MTAPTIEYGAAVEIARAAERDPALGSRVLAFLVGQHPEIVCDAVLEITRGDRQAAAEWARQQADRIRFTYAARKHADELYHDTLEGRLAELGGDSPPLAAELADELEIELPAEDRLHVGLHGLEPDRCPACARVERGGPGHTPDEIAEYHVA